VETAVCAKGEEKKSSRRNQNVLEFREKFLFRDCEGFPRADWKCKCGSHSSTYTGDGWFRIIDDKEQTAPPPSSLQLNHPPPVLVRNPLRVHFTSAAS
jgi:hypothetical protein